jgi:copper resistance protein B
VRRLPLAPAALAVLLAAAPAYAQAPAPDPHAGHQAPAPPPVDPHAGHPSSPDSGPSGVTPASAGQGPEVPDQPLPPFIPPITDADRRAAFPDVPGHAIHDDVVNWFVLFDQVEGRAGQGDEGGSWDVSGWIGKDRDRLWFRTEGVRTAEGDFDDVQTHLLYGRQFARWWDVVGGVRQDFAPGPAQTWAAVGVQGLAPYWFEVEATGYVGGSGRTHVRFEAEHDLLLTNRLVLQPIVEFEVYGKDDLERNRAKGLTEGELGLRLRYVVRRELAPYVGLVWTRKFFGTADLARAQGDRTAGVRFAFGLRAWM